MKTAIVISGRDKANVLEYQSLFINIDIRIVFASASLVFVEYLTSS